MTNKTILLRVTALIRFDDLLCGGITSSDRVSRTMQIQSIHRKTRTRISARIQI
jgi:hypothetical protein